MRLHPAAPLVLLAGGGSASASAVAIDAVAGDSDIDSPSSAGSVPSPSSGGIRPLRRAASDIDTTNPNRLRRLQTATTSTVTYPTASPLSTPLPNPERGFYWQDSYRSSAPVRLTASSLISQRENAGMTLMLRLYYLDSFISSDISQSVLDDIEADFDAMRAAGIKCVLRFAYIDDNTAPFVSEPAKAQLLTHIGQLAPVLAGGEDVIALVQAGFLGPWGEWHSSTHFDGDLAGRKEVVAALLEAVPGERVVQIRTPTHKKELYEEFQYPDPTGGYLSDGGFENGASNWGAYGGGFVLDTTETHDGSANSAKVTNGGARQWVALTPPAASGYTVRISGHSRGVNTPSDIGSDYSIYADVAMVDGAGQTSYMWGQTAKFLEGDTGAWEYAQHDFVVPDGKEVTGMTVYAMYRNQAQGTHAYFDDVDVQVFAPPVQTAGQVLDSASAHDGTHIARTGHHNDCFLASDSDYGTYPDSSQSEYSYLSDETKYTAMGGETCNPYPPRSECTTALQEMELFHYTYMNSGYHQSVLNSWTTGGCMDEAKAKLGYRLVLKDGTFPDAAAPGSVVPFEVNLDNEGWAAPINERRVQLVFKHVSTDELCAATADAASVDVRTWYGGESHVLAGEATLPSDMPAGQYSLYLHITDTSSALRTKVEFKTKVANDGSLNDATTGLIDLGHVIDVATGNPTSSSTAASQISVTCGSGVESDILPPASPTLSIDPNSLVDDGSFENADLSVSWSTYGTGFAAVTDAADVHSGTQAVKVTNGGAARQVVTLNAPAGSTVKISGYSKSSGVSTGLWNDYSIYTDVVYANGGGYLWGQCARFAGGADTEGPDWTYGEWTFVAAKDVAYLTLYTMYRNDGGNGGAGGTAWFDDVSVTVTPP